MTLIVSINIPDGIVIAGDSLSTMMSNRQFESTANIQCPNCTHPYAASVQVPARLQSNSFPYAQKVFPFMKNKFGVGTFGEEQLSGKTIYFAIRELEKKLLTSKRQITTVKKASEVIGIHIQSLMLNQLKQESQKNDITIPEGIYPVGFQITGYDEDKPNTIMMNIGNDIKTETNNFLGISYNGQIEVVNALFSRFTSNPAERPVFELFSVQDAIIYAEFLIKTTALYQRFSANMATVGGEIDIALITPFDGFKWIRQKSLQTLLSGGIDEYKT